MSAKPRIVVSHTDDYDNWHFGGPTNGSRSRHATKLALNEFGSAAVVIEPDARAGGRQLQLTHSRKYIAEVMDGGECPEVWAGVNFTLARLARTMFGGTMQFAQAVARNPEPALYINWMGAKHHAQRDSGAGFCVFNDMAAAAKLLADKGLNVAYLDWDAHAGDGVEDLTWDDTRILTWSVHEDLLYPYIRHTTLCERPSATHDTCARYGSAETAFRSNLVDYSADSELIEHVEAALARFTSRRKPDVLLLASGADGFHADPLSTLQYSHAGFLSAGELVGEYAKELGIPVIFGGAGGYLPDTHTPMAWAMSAVGVASGMGVR